MKIRLTQLSVALDYTDETVVLAAASRLGVGRQAVRACSIVRSTIDARRLRGRVRFILNVVVEIDDAAAGELRDGEPIVDDVHETPAGPGPIDMPHRPVVVGAGPAGLLAAWRLANAGVRPILIERGAPVADRRRSARQFWAHGTLDPEDNTLYGEGGAGLFSDGKLTTRSKQRGHLRTVLDLLVACGGPESILIDAEPHVGSDRLGEIVQCLRERIVALGGEVRFHARLDGLELDAGRLVGLIVNGERLATDHCVLATGHSARDVYHMLHDSHVPLAAKAFAIGVRIEVPQSQIDRSQFGRDAGHPRLGAATFRLTRREESDVRACYTFCMCPGGSVIACTASAGELTTNGMSLSGRAGPFGNAALLVPVRPEDCGGDADPLAGIAWRQAIEAKAFAAGGGDYSLPAANLEDFIARRASLDLPAERSCLRSVPADLHGILPAFVSDALVHAAGRMLGKLAAVRLADGVVYAAETRSSSPVRIVRGDDFQSVGAGGLYPAGEGAGYAGGIVTSAIDGLRAADALLMSLN
ncbi:hypothetical protein LCGC14_0274530 [marine sediment metagenome]|uniref:Uncharacterized protein n=1 Tax=marine sediment metagenome TaxID=412755 RepID=A0A0F9TXU7_9ZZZZ|nr:FAD-binding protein [Phycisphaerae bacterium]HDZ43407.1 FAD-binding protein [Phycisphaerae bacterium]